MNIINKNLFDEILIDPITKGAEKLLVVSGYATANMVARHAHYVKTVLNKRLDVELIVGMCSQDGLEIKNHKAFLQLQNNDDFNFKCDYVINRPAVHTKLYTWIKEGKPYLSFIGSANYTQNGFSSSMREALTGLNAHSSLEYFNSLKHETINCASSQDTLNSEIEFYERKRIIKDYNESNESDFIIDNSELPKVSLTLLTKELDELLVPKRSGLNWGQRPEYNRNPNQAYINIPAHICRSSFFPEVGNTFTIETDDDKQLICVRAQSNGKGLHTTLNNALMGEYFRYRLGLKNGEAVNIQHLLKYGRTDVDVYKIDEETYYLDFSV